jgi:energy-coupling factor transporter ATP-binding protein EcfA2
VESVEAVGSSASIVEKFGIRGLYGYRSIALSSDVAATILIAGNGTGKTTLLAALDAFLRREYFRLRDLEFDEIYCRIRGVEDELILTRTDLDELIDHPPSEEMLRLARRIDKPVPAVFRFITEEWPKASKGGLPDSQIFSSIMQSAGHSPKRVRQLCDELYADTIQASGRIAQIDAALAEALREHEIVYLPTYRRVELALRPNEGESNYSFRRRRPKIELTPHSLYTSDIQFGLGDISDRLEQLNNQVLGISNEGYVRISADIMRELIDGTFDRSDQAAAPKPPEDDLELFFRRLGQMSRRGPYFGPALPELSAVPDLSKVIAMRGSSEESSKFLQYFLGKIEGVISTTRTIERSIEAFIQSCNKYLGSEELSTRLEKEGMRSEVRTDAKALRLDRQNFSVLVESVPGGRPIPLEALSSGEKQMISLFAKLFLYDGKKIVLIDEPELSLSIDWQRDILVDVLSAESCDQAIAITHSPFIFDNSLEPYARSLELSVNLDKIAIEDGGDLV